MLWTNSFINFKASVSSSMHNGGNNAYMGVLSSEGSREMRGRGLCTRLQVLSKEKVRFTEQSISEQKSSSLPGLLRTASRVPQAKTPACLPACPPASGLLAPLAKVSCCPLLLF